MTFEFHEEGQGTPAELYEFRRGISATYRMTSHDADIVFLTNTFSTTTIKRTSDEQSQEMERNSMKVSISREELVALNFIQFPTTEITTLTVWRQHIDDTDNQFTVVWQGRLLAAEFKGSMCELTCEPIFTSLKRPGLRRSFSAQCPHILYGGQCLVNNQTFRVDGILATVSGLTINSLDWNTFAAGYFAGGYLFFNNVEYRTVRESAADGTFIMNAPFGSEVIVGSTVQAFPGCLHSMSDCDTKFANIVNYGGFPHIPPKNPFGGTILY